MNTTVTPKLTQNDEKVIARFFAGRPSMLQEMGHDPEVWAHLARRSLEKRMSELTDVLSNGALEAIATGKIDLPATCKSIAKEAGIS